MRHPATRALFAHWDALRGERAAPDRSEVLPADIRHILADTFILDASDPGESSFRLAGTRLCAIFARELKGASFIDLWDIQERVETARMVASVTEHGVGVVAGLRGETPSGATINLEIVLLPLRDRARRTSRLIGAMGLSAMPGWIGLDGVDTLSTISVRLIDPQISRPGQKPFHARDGVDEQRPRFTVIPGGRQA
jgi:hypothetical protein